MNFCVVHLIVCWATFSEIPQLSDSTLEVMLNLILIFTRLLPLLGGLRCLSMSAHLKLTLVHYSPQYGDQF